MASEDVKVKMSADDADVQRAWQQMFGAISRLDAKLNDLGKTATKTAKAGDESMGKWAVKAAAVRTILESVVDELKRAVAEQERLNRLSESEAVRIETARLQLHAAAGTGQAYHALESTANAAAIRRGVDPAIATQVTAALAVNGVQREDVPVTADTVLALSRPQVMPFFKPEDSPAVAEALTDVLVRMHKPLTPENYAELADVIARKRDTKPQELSALAERAGALAGLEGVSAGEAAQLALGAGEFGEEPFALLSRIHAAVRNKQGQAALRKANLGADEVFHLSPQGTLERLSHSLGEMSPVDQRKLLGGLGVKGQQMDRTIAFLTKGVPAMQEQFDGRGLQAALAVNEGLLLQQLQQRQAQLAVHRAKPANVRSELGKTTEIIESERFPIVGPVGRAIGARVREQLENVIGAPLGGGSNPGGGLPSQDSNHTLKAILEQLQKPQKLVVDVNGAPRPAVKKAAGLSQ